MGANPHTPPAPAAGVRIHLLGAFAVAIDDQLVPEGAWRLRKAKTLVKLLALAPGHRLHREQVIAVLWPDRAPEAAANNLHQVLHVARRQLDGGSGGRRCLRLEHDVLSLCAEEELWIDAEAFRGEAVAALRAGDPERAAAALELYPGPLLPEELYEAWTEPTRAELGGLRDELASLAAGVVARPGDGGERTPRQPPGRAHDLRRPREGAGRARPPAAAGTAGHARRARPGPARRGSASRSRLAGGTTFATASG